MWHQYVAIATLNYNTSYHSALGCEPSRKFNGRIPYNVLYHKFGIRSGQHSTPKTNPGEDILHATDQRNSEQKRDAILHMIQTVLRQKNKCSPTSRQRILLRTTPQSEYPEY